MSLKEKVAEFMTREFPQTNVVVEEVGNRSAKVRQPIGEEHLRPGGTVSGPVLMAVADVAMYAAILGEIGLVALAVTTNFTINFLRKPSATCDILGECRLMKVGKRLVVGEVLLYSEGDLEPVAHAVGTYSIPPVR
ncbi:PaaI family thioesterase [Pontibacter ruber]|uniref:PaaI family thioesterase n=1 Tax=Pontibacter ruber TaxID=1343895 RepID=A0ABW5D031_9BACT|nr:PaaI family thioesterase [Pontibacter ruber]